MIETARSAALPSLPPGKCAAGTAESRLDPITGEWTIFAPDRNQRPEEFKVTHKVTADSTNCPFCQGHESETPPPVWIGRIENDEPLVDTGERDMEAEDWSVRVVPNKFPAVTSNGNGRGDNGSRAADRECELFQCHTIAGGHEVIIESPNHIESITKLDPADVCLVFKAYQDRIRYWSSQPQIRYISVFKNVGGEAGASLRHGHSQLVAVDRRPRLVSAMLDRMRHHTATTGCCLQCDLIRGELKSKRRIIAQTESLVAFCPFASRLPMLVKITTKSHQPRFEDLDSETIEQVSRLTLRAIKWLEQIHPRTAYNYVIHTCPPGTSSGSDAFHWSLELFPRLTQVAGFEWGSQCMINPVLPELAAARFRSRAAAEDPRIVL